MEIQYQILKEKHLLIQKYIGVFSIDHYSKYVYKVLDLPDWEYVKKVLTDARDVDLKNAFLNLDALSIIRKEIIKRRFLNVFIVDEPVSTATAHIYKKKLSKKDYEYEYCSTLEYALEALGIKGCESEIESVLNNLKYSI